MAEEAEVEKGSEEAKPKSKKLLFLIIGVVLLLLLAGGGFFAWKMFFTKEEPPPLSPEDQAIQDVIKKEAEAKAFLPEKDLFFSLDPFIINLNDRNAKHYLKAVVELEVRRQEILRELEQNTPQIRDIILFILMNKTYDDIITNEGKANLKHEITMRINNILKTGTLEKLFITDFIVQ